MPGQGRKVLWAATAVVVLLVLWVVPPAIFSNPTTNEVIDLSAWGGLVVLLVLAVSALSLLPVLNRGWNAEVPISLGALSVGAGLAAVAGLLTFGNMSNDRFMPLLFLPWLMVPVGMGVLLGGLFMRARAPADGRAAVLRATLCVLVIAGWLFARGARDWLLAPYGFDWFLLIALAAAVLIVTGMARKAGASATSPPSPLARQ